MNNRHLDIISAKQLISVLEKTLEQKDVAENLITILENILLYNCRKEVNWWLNTERYPTSTIIANKLVELGRYKKFGVGFEDRYPYWFKRIDRT